MKKISYYLSFLIIFNACSNGTKDVKEEKNVIHLAEAIENPVKMNLSEIVDSIKLIDDAPADINTPEELAEAQKYMK